MQTSLFRAKVCEKLAKITYKQNFSEYFLIGMFLVIDSLLQRPMSSVLSQLPFPEEITDTILGKQTEMLPYLEFSIALGKFDWDTLEELAPKFNLTMESIELLHKEALQWAETSILI